MKSIAASYNVGRLSFFDPIGVCHLQKLLADYMYFMRILVLNLKESTIKFYGRINRELALELFLASSRHLLSHTTFIDIFSLGQHAIHQRQQAASVGADQTHN